jgi:hypothetical protein
MAEGGKMFAGAKGLGKRVPKWAWYVSGGVLIAGGIYYFVNRGDVTQSDTGDIADDGAVGYTDGQAPGAFIVPSDNGAQAVPAEINTDIPQAGYDFFGRVLDTLGGVIQTQHDDQTEILALLAQGGGDQGGTDAGGTVTAAPAAAGAAPAAQGGHPNPASKLEAGYRAGATVDMGANAKKNFPGAIGWVRIADGDKGAAHWIDVHVRFCNKLERWRVRPNAKGSPWNKTWSGARPNIC